MKKNIESQERTADALNAVNANNGMDSPSTPVNAADNGHVSSDDKDSTLFEVTDNLTWLATIIFPAIIAIIAGIITYKIAADPKQSITAISAFIDDNKLVLRVIAGVFTVLLTMFARKTHREIRSGIWDSDALDGEYYASIADEKAKKAYKRQGIRNLISDILVLLLDFIMFIISGLFAAFACWSWWVLLPFAVFGAYMAFGELHSVILTQLLLSSSMIDSDTGNKK